MYVKAIMSIMVLLFGSRISAEPITIGIALQGGAESIVWKIEKSDDGIIAGAVKTLQSDGSILERLEITRDGDVIVSRFFSKQYKFTQRIKWTGNSLEVQYTTKNDYLHTMTEGNRSLVPVSAGFIDTMDGQVVGHVDLPKGRIYSSSGSALIRRIEDRIYNYKNGTITTISSDQGVTVLVEQVTPEIVPPTRMTVSGGIKDTDVRVTMLNYCLLPTELRYLFFIP